MGKRLLGVTFTSSRHAIIMLIAFLLLSACAGSTSTTSGSDIGSAPTPTPTVTSSSSRERPAFEDLQAGWTKLPPPPEVRSANAATVWTGEQLILWGGYVYTGFSDEVPEGNGFAFDARSRTWKPMAGSPLGPRVLPASAWTGNEVLIWGGSDDRGGFYDDGAAYDPTTDTWRELPPAPVSARAPLSAWTGREFLVWGTVVRVDERPRDGAAYEPVTNEWRTIATAPIELTDATAVWTGREMIVFGAGLHGGNKPDTDTAIAAAYDPTADTWRRLPASELSPQASTAAWDGKKLIAWDYLNDAAAYDPATGLWRSLARVPLDNYECSPRSVSVQPYVFGDYCGLMAVYDRADETWHDISRSDLAGMGFTSVAADPVILLIGRDVDTHAEAMFAYRPPTW